MLPFFRSAPREIYHERWRLGTLLLQLRAINLAFVEIEAYKTRGDPRRQFENRQFLPC